MSSGERYLKCPGSYHAEQGLPETTSDAAASGTLIHAAAAELIEGRPITTEMAGRDIYIANWIADEWKKVCGEETGIGEQEVLIAHKNKVIWTGHPDRVMLRGRIVIFEFKTGRKEVDTADTNCQGRLYACAVAQSSGFCVPVELHLLVIGNEEGERHTVVNLSVEDLRAAYSDAVTIWKRCQSKKAKFNVGQWCQYCRCEGTPRCPESCKGLAIKEPSLPVDPTQLAILFEAAQNAERIAKKVKDYAKKFVQDGGVIPGHELTAGHTQNVLEDIAAGWSRLSDSMGQADFLKACNISIPALIAIVKNFPITQTASGRTVGEKEAKAFILARLGDLVTEKKVSGSLQKIKTNKEE
jgi:hypothetical protein